MVVSSPAAVPLWPPNTLYRPDTHPSIIINRFNPFAINLNPTITFNSAMSRSQAMMLLAVTTILSVSSRAFLYFFYVQKIKTLHTTCHPVWLCCVRTGCTTAAHTFRTYI